MGIPMRVGVSDFLIAANGPYEVCKVKALTWGCGWKKARREQIGGASLVARMTSIRCEAKHGPAQE